MYREIAKLIMYGDMDRACILYQFGEIFRRFDEKSSSKPELIKDIYTQLKRLLIVATDLDLTIISGIIISPFLS